MSDNGINTIEEYIFTCPEEVQKIIRELHKIVKEIAPDSSETIAWGMPSYKVNGKYIAQFAANKSHIGLYPGPDTMELFKEPLVGYKATKGGVQFPYKKPVPYDIFREIVKFNLSKVIGE